MILVGFIVYFLYINRVEPVQEPEPEPMRKVKPKTKPPPRPVEVRLDPISTFETEVVMMSTKEDLVKEIEKVVEAKIEKRNEVAKEISKMERREIEQKEETIQIIKAETEEVMEEKTTQLVSLTSALEELMNKRRAEFLEEKKRKQEADAARLLLEKEKKALENEKKLAELRLVRRKALEELEKAEKSKSDLEKEVKEQELVRLEEAKVVVEEQKAKLEAEAEELKKQVESSVKKIEADEALYQKEKAKIVNEQKRLEDEYKEIEAQRAEKIKEAEDELNELLESEKERQTQMEADDERLRQEETKRLLDANEEALKELEEAEAEQARMDAELEAAEAAMSDTIQQQQQKQIDERDAVVAQGEQDELAALAAQQLLQQTSEQTGDAEQQAERDAALLLEQTSERDWDTLTAGEQRAALDAQAQLDADSYAAVPDYGENPAMLFDYAAYERGDPIDCVPGEWSEWEKVGDLQEETKTIEEGQGLGARTYEVKTGRWKQGWQRTQEPIVYAMNGGKGCPLTERKYTTQPSRECGEEDWNEWTNDGEAFSEGPPHNRKWYQNQKRTRATEVVPDGCNLREDTRKKTLSSVNCVWGGWSGWTVGPRYEEQVWRGEGGLYGDRRLVPSGKWVEDHTRTRSKTVQERYGGKCEGVSTEKITKPAGAKDCVTGEWGNWEDASEPTEAVKTQGGRGGVTEIKLGYWTVLQQRKRPMLEPAQNGGICSLGQIRTHTLPKVNCEFGGWSDWTFVENVRHGNSWYKKEKRTRTKTVEEKYGGVCDGGTEEYKETLIPAVNCVQSEWSEWDNGYKADRKQKEWLCRGAYNHSCGHFGPMRWYRQDKRTRSTITPAAWGGTACGPTEETRETVRNPVNCVLGGWGGWTNSGNAYEEVRTQGGRGGVTYINTGKWKQSQNRTRSITTPAAYGGTCSAARRESRTVNVPAQNCVQSAWSGWVHQRHWNSGNNWYDRQKRTRTTTTPAAYGGTACGATSEERDVGMAKVHCETSGWSGWTNGYKADVVKASHLCKWRGGRGGSYSCKWDGPARHYRQDKRTRSITRHPAWGGNGCPTLEETRETMRNPVNCTVSGWNKSRVPWTRTITQHPAYGGNGCPSLSYTPPAPAPSRGGGGGGGGGPGARAGK